MKNLSYNYLSYARHLPHLLWATLFKRKEDKFIIHSLLLLVQKSYRLSNVVFLKVIIGKFNNHTSKFMTSVLFYDVEPHPLLQFSLIFINKVENILSHQNLKLQQLKTKIINHIICVFQFALLISKVKLTIDMIYIFKTR